MPGGRPSKGKQVRYPELEELASWFHQALIDAGYESIHAFLSRGLFEKNAVYGVFGATRLLTLESTQSLAVALKRSPTQVMAVWMRAKEARDRAVLASVHSEQATVRSWAHLPLPSLPMRNLLEAQSNAADRLPYEMLGVKEPPLSTVYVRQAVHSASSRERNDRELSPAPTPVPDERGSLERQQPALPVRDALDRHDHLVITGEPGAGKSTLSSYLAGRLSRIWLREESATDPPLTEPVVPVRVPARYLDGSGSWSSVLAESVSRFLGRGLVEDPPPLLFTGRAQGARWLVLVDGLDEVPDPRIRGEIVRCIAQHARTGSGYRFVVTTRELPEAELAPLRLSNAGNYSIHPFGPENLREFCIKWFTAQELPSVNDYVDRFLRETSDGRLRELVRNPLLATIAAVSAVREPSRALPTSRISLYERFCGYLSRDRGGGRDRVPQLRRHYIADPERLNFVLWTHQSRPELLSTLARCRLESEDMLWPAAVAWVRDNVPSDIMLVDNWEEHLWEELTSSGLLVASGHELRFLHQSFAEFLSAQACSETIDEDFSDLETWIRRGLRNTDRNLVLFTFAKWARLPGRNIDIVANNLLGSRDPRRVLLAGRLLAEGVTFPEDTVARVVNRLTALARNADDSDIAVEAFEALGTLFDHPAVVGHLDELARDGGLYVSRRMEAVAAFEHLQGGERAHQLMAEILPSSYGNVLRRAASIAVRLGGSAVEQVRQRTLVMRAEPDADSEDIVFAAEVMRELALPDETAALADAVMRSSVSEASDLSRAAEAWHSACGDTAVAAIAELAVARPTWDYSGKAGLARILARIGATDVAASLARAVLRDDPADGGAAEDAVAALLTATGVDGISEALAIADRWSEPPRLGELWHAGRMLKLVAQVSQEAGIMPRIRLLLESNASSRIGADDLVDAWLTLEGSDSAASVMDLLDRGTVLNLYTQAELTELLQKVGANTEAAELAERILQSRIGKREQFTQAARAFLKVSEPNAASSILSLTGQLTWPPPQWLAGVMDALESEGSTAQTEQVMIHLANKLAAHPQADSEELRDALGILLQYGNSPSSIEFVAEQAAQNPRLYINHRRDLTVAMAAVGELESAKAVWRNMLEWQEYSSNYEIELIDAVLQAGAGQWAAGQIGILISAPGKPALRIARLRQMQAWLTLAKSNAVPG